MTLLMRDREKIAEGKIIMLKVLVDDRIITMDEASKSIGVTEDQLKEMFDTLSDN